MAENFQLERFLSSCGLQGTKLLHICLYHACELISADFNRDVEIVNLRHFTIKELRLHHYAD